MSTSENMEVVDLDATDAPTSKELEDAEKIINATVPAQVSTPLSPPLLTKLIPPLWLI